MVKINIKKYFIIYLALKKKTTKRIYAVLILDLQFFMIQIKHKNTPIPDNFYY